MAGRHAGGVEVYEVGLLRALARLDRTNRYHVFCTGNAAATSFALDQANFTFHRLSSRRRFFTYAVTVPRLAAAIGCDVLHSTYASPPLGCKVPSIFSMHDTSVFDRPDFYHVRHRMVLQWWQANSLRHARRILCPSTTTSDSVRKRFPDVASGISVIYHGVGQELIPMPREDAWKVMAQRYAVSAPYAIYVGQLRTLHKNLIGLLEAFAICRREVAPKRVQLMLVGKRSWTTVQLEARIQRLGLSADVVLPGHISTEELGVAMSGARMLAFPSHSEGFGFAVTEAMSCGTPVVASRATSLPEIVGEGGILVDPNSPEDIARAMARIFTDDQLSEELSRKGFRRAGQFSWERCARETIEQYQSVARLPS
jgi:glycosyltransferase involved in cell wall biosynthesis